MKAFEILNKLQAAYYKPVIHSQESNQEFELILRKMLGNSYEKVMAKYAEEKSKLHTKYEDLHLIGLIAYSFDMLKEILNTNKFTLNDKTLEFSSQFPLYGTIQNANFRAYIIPADDIPLIIFSEGMLKFANSIIMITNYENMYYNQLTKQERDALTREFIDIMICYHFYGDAYYAEKSGLYSPSEKISHDDYLKNDLIKLKYEIHEELMWLMEIGVYFFFVAHEYSHIILSPLETQKHSTIKINNIETDVIIKSLEQELSADSLAFTLSKKANNPEYGMSSYLATIIMYLGSIHMDYEDIQLPLSIRMSKMLKLCEKNKCHLDDSIIGKNFNAKIKHYIRFLGFLDSKGFKCSNEQSLSDFQNLLYHNYELPEDLQHCITSVMQCKRIPVWQNGLEYWNRLRKGLLG